MRRFTESSGRRPPGPSRARVQLRRRPAAPRHEPRAGWPGRARRLASQLRWHLATALVRRLATAEMRRAALLLGMDIGLNGARHQGLLARLEEFSTGVGLGRALRSADEQDRRQATEVFALERLLYR